MDDIDRQTLAMFRPCGPVRRPSDAERIAHLEETNRQLRLKLQTENNARRDRFIAAALTGFISACDDFDARHFDDSVCARSSIEMADAVLSLLDSESSETSETFERESEGKL